MGVGGCPTVSNDHALEAVKMSLDMILGTAMINTPNGEILQVRAGTEI